MNEELGKRLAEVQDEAQAMLKNIHRVKGKRYGSTVQLLLLVKQTAEIASFMCEAIDELGNEDLAHKMAEAMSNQLVYMGTTVSGIADFTDEQWKEIIQDVESMSDNVSNLIRVAVDSPEWGGKRGA